MGKLIITPEILALKAEREALEKRKEQDRVPPRLLLSGLRRRRTFRRGGWSPPRSGSGVKSWSAPACAGCKRGKQKRSLPIPSQRQIWQRVDR